MTTTNDRIIQLEATIKAHQEAWAAYQEIEQLWLDEVAYRLDLADLVTQLRDLFCATTSAEETQ